MLVGHFYVLKSILNAKLTLERYLLTKIKNLDFWPFLTLEYLQKSMCIISNWPKLRYWDSSRFSRSWLFGLKFIFQRLLGLNSWFVWYKVNWILHSWYRTRPIWPFLNFFYFDWHLKYLRIFNFFDPKNQFSNVQLNFFSYIWFWVKIWLKIQFF